MSDTYADLQLAYPGDDTSANGTNLYGNLKQLYLLKKKNRSLKTMFSIGGYTYSPNYIPVLASESMRATFASSAVSILANLGFDGINIDYEYVTNSDQATQLVDLLKKLRTGLDAYASNTSSSPFLLTFCSPAGPDHYKQLDFQGMDQYLDFWDYMGFDYTGGWSSISGHSANLFEDFNNPLSTPFNTSSALAYYFSEGGIHPSKVNLGSPLYAHAFADTDGPGKPCNGSGTAGSFGSAGIWDYKALPLSGSNVTAHDLRRVGASYTYDKQQRYMISYDTPTIAKIKAEYVVSQGLGGSMWWEVSMDKVGSQSLIATSVGVFGGSAGLDGGYNHLAYPESEYVNLREGFPSE